MRLKQHLLQRCISYPLHLRRNLQTTSSLQLRQNPREFPAGNDFSYEEVVKNFKWDLPERFNFSKDIIDKYAKSDG